MLKYMKKNMEEREQNEKDNNRLGKKFWKLKLQEKNICGSIVGDKEKNNGKKS